MSDIPKQATIKLHGRESIVQFIQLWGDDKLSIVLADPRTAELQEFCTVSIPDVPLGPQQVLVKNELVGVLSDAGVVRPTEQGIAANGVGILWVCDVVDHPPHLAWEGHDSPRNTAQRQQEAAKTLDDPEIDFER